MVGNKLKKIAVYYFLINHWNSLTDNKFSKINQIAEHLLIQVVLLRKQKEDLTLLFANISVSITT
jgi:hypothetical protein